MRTISESELPEFCAAMSVGFLRPVADVQAEADARRAAMFWDRTWAGFDGAKMVSTLRAFPVELTVPGGATLPTSAVTAVTTTATHRRRGLASRMMIAELQTAKARGERAAVLHASEWPIYGRFGYGPATQACTLIVDAGVARLRTPAAGTAELVDRDTARGLLPAVYEAHRVKHPGEISRSDRFFDIDLGIVRYPSWGELKPGFQVVVRDPAGDVVGMARYEVEDNWENSRPRNVAKASLFLTTNAVGNALLWQYLLGLDLVTQVEVESCSVDDPLPFLLSDGRHVHQRDSADSLWLRLLDVPAALAARRYLTSGRLVLEVVDRLGFAGGQFAVEGGPERASCSDTGASPDLTMDIATLGAAYLGGHTFGTLHAAGLVHEHKAGGVRLADAMFRSETPPLCTTGF